jgi:hypothetical protein
LCNNDNRNEEGTMNCEICKVIQKLGLPKSAHELWICTDKASWKLDNLLQAFAPDLSLQNPEYRELV